MRARPAVDRLWTMVRRGGPDECWPFVGRVVRRGYGRVSVPNGVPERSRFVAAHRVAYESTHGPIPAGLSVCHRCDVPLCCNPSHLFLGSPADNNRDRDLKGRHVPLRGERNGRRVFTDEHVRSMRRLRLSGHSLRELAWLFHSSSTHISNICKGRLWPHVSEVG